MNASCLARALVHLACCTTLTPGVLAAPLSLHVAPGGSDTQPGTADKPLLTLDRARDALRTLRREGRIPAEGATVVVHGGLYPVRQSLRLDPADSGTRTAPVVFRAAPGESPVFSGGAQLAAFKPATDPADLDRLAEGVRGRVLVSDLAVAGVTEVLPFSLGGFSSGRGFRTHPAMELFVDGEPMTLARWPNEGFVKTGEVPAPLTLPAYDGKRGSPEGRFRFEGDRPARWVKEPDAWLYGYWFWDWADSYEKIERIDLDAREIHLARPWHGYGYRRGQRFHAINLLSELDAPGEWYLDRERRRVFLMPPRDLDGARVELSVLAAPLLELQEVSHVVLEGLTWDLGASDGVRVHGGEGVVFRGCTIRRMAGNGIEVRGGLGHTLDSCDIHHMGRGGVALEGGDRRTLTPSGHRVQNCHIHHLSRIDHTYTPAIWMNGVGHHIRHNLMHHVASSAMRVEGNDHLVELNEAHHVVTESDDQGAVDMFGNPTYRGNIYRHNYWHHLGTWDRQGADHHNQRAGIRLDDAICGTLVEGNIFQRCSTDPTHFGGVQIHGGKENTVQGNLFIDTGAAVSFTPWGDKRWREFVARALDAPAIDRALYLARYPALAVLPEGHDANMVRSNVTVRCGPLFLRAPGGLQSAANVEFATDTGLPESADGRLRWSDADARRLGVAHIPFASIGLRTNAWRTRVEGEWRLSPQPP